MRILFIHSCCIILALAGESGRAAGDAPSVRRHSSEASYRAGLMFAGGGTDRQPLSVHDVVPGGAAAAAGVRAGDLITHINGAVVDRPASGYAAIFSAPNPIRFRVLRDGERLDLTVTPQKVGSAEAPPPGARRLQAVESMDGHVRVPMRMDYGKPTVLASVNGKGPWHFFVDSGAGVTVLDRALVRELALPVTGERRIGGPSNPESINADIVRIESIKIGSLEFRDVEVVSWDRSDLYMKGDRPRGVLGLGLFSDYLLSFDYPAGEIALSSGELPPVDHNEIIPYTMTDYGIPAIEIRVGAKNLVAHFDTGSPGSLGLPARLEPELRFKAPPRVMGKARTVDKEFEIRGASLDGDVTIGGHVFKEPQVLLLDVLDNLNTANIGSRLLREFVLSFDQKNMRLRLKRG